MNRPGRTAVASADASAVDTAAPKKPLQESGFFSTSNNDVVGTIYNKTCVGVRGMQRGWPTPFR